MTNPYLNLLDCKQLLSIFKKSSFITLLILQKINLACGNFVIDNGSAKFRPPYGISYKCESNYVLEGLPVVTCNPKTGKFEPSIPKCVLS